MVKERFVNIRLTEAEYAELAKSAKRQGLTVSAFIRETVRARVWRGELKRNQAYHRSVLDVLGRIEKSFDRGERAGKTRGRSRVKE